LRKQHFILQMCMHTLETPDTDGLDAALAAGFQTRLPGWD